MYLLVIRKRVIFIDFLLAKYIFLELQSAVLKIVVGVFSRLFNILKTCNVSPRVLVLESCFISLTSQVWDL